MEKKCLVIYGVFEKETSKCVMVGSTVRWPQRVKDYKRYKWYFIDKHEHRILWEGFVLDDEFLHLLRACKEALWIGRMKTRKDQGGLNWMNPVLHAIRNPEYFSKLCSAGGSHKWTEAQKKARSEQRSGKKHSEETKQKIRESQLGRKHPHTEETKQKLRERPGTRRGAVLSSATKKKLSLARIHFAAVRKQKESVLDFFDIWESQQEAA